MLIRNKLILKRRGGWINNSPPLQTQLAERTIGSVWKCWSRGGDTCVWFDSDRTAWVDLQVDGIVDR